MIFGLVSTKEILTKKFEASIPDKLEFIPNYNLRPGSTFLFLSSSKPNEFTNYRFGMVPSGSKDERILYEAPVENAKYHTHDVIIKKDIIFNPDFRKPIRQQRGLLPVDYFIIQSSDGKPYLIFQKDKKRPMALACVWDAWKQDILDDLVYGFAVITVPVLGQFSKFGIEEMPLILTEYNYKKWLKTDSSLSRITPLLEPLDEKYINAYPLSDKIKTSLDNDRDLILPSGDLLIPDEKPLPPFVERYGHRKKRKIKVIILHWKKG